MMIKLSGSSFVKWYSRAIAERGRDEFTRCRLRQRYVECYVQSTIHSNVLVSPSARDQDIFGLLLRLFTFRILQGVFSLFPCRVFLLAHQPRIHLSTRNLVVLFARMRVYVYTGLKTTFVCGSVKSDPMQRRLRSFASWEIGVKILDGSVK